MTPRERFLTALRGGTADRAPLSLPGFIYRNIEQLERENDPLKKRLAERILPETHYFVHVPAYLNRYLVTPPQFFRETGRKEKDGTTTYTQEIRTPKGPLTAIRATNPLTATSWQVKYPVETPEDIDKISSVAWELPDKLATPDLKDLPADFDRRGIVQTSVSCPMVCVAGMMPFESFLELCVTDLPLVKELTEVCTKRTLAVLDVLLPAKKIEYVWMGGCEWLTPPMASPRLYNELVQPFEERIIQRIHAGGALAHVHCHGKVSDSLEQVIARGADFFEPVEPPPDGDITFAEAKRRTAGRMTLGGNLEARVLENEDVATVEQAVRAAFEGGTARMVLQTTAGPLDKLTPAIAQNYHRLIDLWQQLS